MATITLAVKSAQAPGPKPAFQALLEFMEQVPKQGLRKYEDLFGFLRLNNCMGRRSDSVLQERENVESRDENYAHVIVLL